MSDDLFEDLRGAGTHDSDGAFTVDTRRARRTLEQFQLADPTMWPVLVVTAAVASEASALTVKTAGGNLVIAMDGRRFDLSRLLDAVVSQRGEGARTRDLATAIHALRGNGAESITVETWDGQGGMKLDLDKKQLKLLEVRPRTLNLVSSRSSGTCLTVEGIGGRANGTWAKWSGWPERRALGTQCAFAPLRVTFEGETIEHRQGLGRADVVRIVSPPEHDAIQRFNLHPVEAERVQRVEGAFAAVLVRGRPSRTVLVLNGQSFEFPRHALPGTLCVADAWGLSKDLSHAGLVHDSMLEERMEFLRHEFREMEK